MIYREATTMIPSSQPNAAYQGKSLDGQAEIGYHPVEYNQPHISSPKTLTNAQRTPSEVELCNKFSAQDMQLLRQLLVSGEKFKWKQITREINRQATSRRQSSVSSQSTATSVEEEVFGGMSSELPHQTGAVKNISPTFVVKQYQSLLGLPSVSAYFGLPGSSLPYVVAENGWDDITEVKNDVD
ncbi:Piso0_000037 [Millerozyma farinosa CBS 7064]|uniref:Piso0_000037 protein n=1 Tax=Pichia sorbitophila (strain ATCC MYA-4447 / BCRC 22081 / CBS 7064 / NBRC 10061 / NRRL Y-12695) TaxID=559304 RepID=G8YUD3_PICSO|nr:Piso0_000037 [Millerozyma farinosa CBS 7064]